MEYANYMDVNKSELPVVVENECIVDDDDDGDGGGGGGGTLW